MKRRDRLSLLIVISIVLLSFLFLTSCGREKKTSGVSAYDVVWDTPSRNSLGSMPLGNGDIGLNVWVEPDGDLCFYISKTDAWDENSRLVKIGKLRVSFSPGGKQELHFTRQHLDLEEGAVRIDYGDSLRLTLWVDAHHPAVCLDVEGQVPVSCTVTNEMWRTRRDTLAYILHGDVLYDGRYEHGSKEPVVVDPDSVVRGFSDRIGWYHHNARSVGPAITSEFQGIADLVLRDPILHRTFGAMVIADGKAERRSDTVLFLPAAKEHHLMAFVRTDQPASSQQWLQRVEEDIRATLAVPRDKRWEDHRRWWHAFWDRSHIFITPSQQDTSEDAFIVSRGYTLQRFITACAGRGNYPIKFNGSIFTMNFPGYPGGPDFRRWGPAYWWQNTRLPYISMCASGDYEMMQPLFRMYVDSLFTFFRERTLRYLHHEGLYLTEEMYIWGAIPLATYGWDSTFAQRKDKLQVAGYHKYEWVSGLELLHMMLDYWEHTLDTTFLKEKVLPFGNEVLLFFDRHYGVDSSGKLVMRPAQALETWWDCRDPMPELAGLYANTARLLDLDTSLTTPDERAFWRELREKLPEIPLRVEDGDTLLAPAREYRNKNNLERPEMYAVFPFRLFAVGKPHLNWARAAMEHPIGEVAHGGWAQDDIFYAYLGEAEKARKAVSERARGQDPRVRFPAFWGPNFDWTPDQDHGGVLMKAVQSMVLQTDGEKIYLLPAWPKEWNVDFRLHAPYHTTISGTYRNGTLQHLKVDPPEREKDIIFPTP